jgi:hypothetical protein
MVASGSVGVAGRLHGRSDDVVHRTVVPYAVDPYPEQVREPERAGR